MSETETPADRRWNEGERNNQTWRRIGIPYGTYEISDYGNIRKRIIDYVPVDDNPYTIQRIDRGEYERIYTTKGRLKHSKIYHEVVVLGWDKYNLDDLMLAVFGKFIYMPRDSKILRIKKYLGIPY